MGYPLTLTLTGGQVNDGVMLKTALEPLNIEGSTVLADKAYGSRENRDYITDRKADYCIPPKSNAKEPWECDYHLTESAKAGQDGLDKPARAWYNSFVSDADGM